MREVRVLRELGEKEGGRVRFGWMDLVEFVIFIFILLIVVCVCCSFVFEELIE